MTERRRVNVRHSSEAKRKNDGESTFTITLNQSETATANHVSLILQKLRSRTSIPFLKTICRGKPAPNLETLTFLPHLKQTLTSGTSLAFSPAQFTFTSMQHFVYIARCADNSIYVGCTRNLENRLKAHNKGKVKSTSYRYPLSIITYLAFEEKYKAFLFEKYLKTGSGRAFLWKRLI